MNGQDFIHIIIIVYIDIEQSFGEMLKIHGKNHHEKICFGWVFFLLVICIYMNGNKLGDLPWNT